MKSWAGKPDPLEPRGWIVDASFAPPDLSQAPQIACTDWIALRPPDAAAARLVAGCFETKLSTWSDEIEPMALDKIASMALSTALRVRSDATLLVREAPRDVQRAGAVRTQSLAGTGARAKTSFGFVRDEGAEALSARACFVLCVADDRDECARAVDAAEPIAPYVDPPPAALWLRVTLAAVHHPRATALGVLALACALGVVALVTRRRPRYAGHARLRRK